MLNTYATCIAHSKSVRVVAEEATQVTALQEYDGPVPRTVDEAVSEDLCHAAEDLSTLRSRRIRA
jgi:hypothetical protein